MRKPKCVYILTIFRALYIDLWVRSGIACTDPNCIFVDIVVKKGIELLYIMSIANVISLYCSGMGIGLMIQTGIAFFLVVFSCERTYIWNKHGFCSNYVFCWDGTVWCWLFVTILMIFCFLVAQWHFGSCELKSVLSSPSLKNLFSSAPQY